MKVKVIDKAGGKYWILKEIQSGQLHKVRYLAEKYKIKIGRIMMLSKYKKNPTTQMICSDRKKIIYTMK